MQDDPVASVRRDRSLARAAEDPNAELCWLATVDDQGVPAVRTLVLREIDEGLALFVNATGPKWQHLSRQPRVEIALWFPSLQRQWRLRATLTALPPEQVSQPWQRRPRSSQVMDYVYVSGLPQSSPLDDTAALHALHARLDRELGAAPEAPATALALALAIEGAECLQIHPGDRLHERHELTRTAEGWARRHLVP